MNNLIFDIDNIYNGFKLSQRFKLKSNELYKFLTYLKSGIKEDKNTYLLLSEKDRQDIQTFIELQQPKKVQQKFEEKIHIKDLEEIEEDLEDKKKKKKR